MFLTKSHHTAGHAEIYAQGDFVRPQFREAIFAELRTYQATTGLMSYAPAEKMGHSAFLRFAFVPQLKRVRFPAHVVKDLPFICACTMPTLETSSREFCANLHVTAMQLQSSRNGVPLLRFGRYRQNLGMLQI
jgi:hypothetical protein